jgi:hypothetical protein
MIEEGRKNALILSKLRNNPTSSSPQSRLVLPQRNLAAISGAVGVQVIKPIHEIPVYLFCLQRSVHSIVMVITYFSLFWRTHPESIALSIRKQSAFHCPIR